MMPLELHDDGPLVGLPIARARSGAVVEERELIERRLQRAEERRAWDTLRNLGAALSA